jgi:hypothetical protein
MRVLVCGGREFGKLFKDPDGKWNANKYAEYEFIQRQMDRFAERNSKKYRPDDNWLPSDIEIIAGGATGVDTAAIDWACSNWLRWQVFTADWETHGRAAGYIRNKQMRDEGKPDIVLAFPGGKGTANMVKLAKEENIPVEEIKYET